MAQPSGLLDHQEVQAFGTATMYEQAQSGWVKEREREGLKDAGAVLKKVSAMLNEATQ